MTLSATSSLRWRLLLAGTVSILIAITLASFALIMLFRQHVESWLDKQLDAHMVQLISGLDRNGEGQLAITANLAEPRFSQPFSGMYWEVALENAPPLRSRSLWDQQIRLPDAAVEDGRLARVAAAGPQGEALYALQRRVILPERLGGQVATFVIAIDDSEVNRAVWSFATILVPFLLTIGLLLATAAWIQVRIGLRPLETVQESLSHIRHGRRDRMGTTPWPREIRPLTDEIDALLQAQGERVAKARARAADLAHGLKTPLQVIRSEARKLAGRGEKDAAANLEQLVTMMSRHVERQMVRARLGSAHGNAAANLAAEMDQVVQIIKNSPTGAQLDWRVDIPRNVIVRIDPDDLVEALGNLVENAARHACKSVEISARHDGERIAIRIADDGRGIAPEAMQNVIERGIRYDTTTPGAGLGLAIVQDIAEEWNGDLSLANTEPGLVVTLRLNQT